MATYYSSYSNEYRLRLDITQGTQNVTNNTSVVSWTLYLLSGNKSMSVYSTYHATVNGVASPNTTQTNVNIGFNTSVTLGSGSTTVTHNADGTKSIPFSASFKTNSPAYSGGVLITPGTMTISGNFALTTIPRYAAITAFTASINDRVATLNWTADKTISQWRYSTNSGSTYTGWTTVNAKSGSAGYNATPGQAYGFRIQVKNSASGLITTSSVLSRTATKTPSTLTLSTTSQNVGSNITWTVNKSYDYTHKMKYTFGGAEGWILGSGSATSNTSTGTWIVPTSLANQIPNATSGVGTIYVYTYYGSVHVGTRSYTFTAKVPNTTTGQPSIPSVTISHVGDRPTGITSYVQGKSRVKVVSSSTAQGGASISSYRVTVSGIGTYYGSNITSGYLTNSGTVTITVRATDSRGYYSEKVSTIPVVAYSPPKLTTYTAMRSPNDQGTNLATSINFSISPIDNKNTKQYRIRYRKTGGTWYTLFDSTDYYTRSTTHSATGVLNTNSSYEVEFYLKDSYTSVTQMRNIGTEFQLMDFNASGRGLAIGKVSESDSFEVGIPTIMSTTEANILTLKRYDTQPNVNLAFENDNQTRYLTFKATGRPAWGDDPDVNLRGYNFWTEENSYGITDSGTNTNGRYIRFSDGTLICHHTSPEVTSWTWSFPATFLTFPRVFAFPTTNGTVWQTSKSVTDVTVNTSTQTLLQVMAIGWWK